MQKSFLTAFINTVLLNGSLMAMAKSSLGKGVKIKEHEMQTMVVN